MGKTEQQKQTSEYIDEHLQEYRAIAMETHKRLNTSKHEYFTCHRLSKKRADEGLDVYSLKFKAATCNPQRRASIGRSAKLLAVSVLDLLLDERRLKSITQQVGKETR